MSETGGIFGRFTRWFRRQWRREEDLPLLYGQTETSVLGARRSLFPWTRANASIDLVESRLSAVTALMVALRNAIDQQTQRHDELLNYLSQLSHALQAIPDTSRVQSEMLRVLHQQIAYQNAQHKQLSEVLRKLAESDTQQHSIVEGLRERVENLYQTDQTIAETVTGVDSAVKVMSQNSQTSTMVLERLRDNLVNHETELDRSIRKQNRLMLTAMGVCIVLSLLAAITVLVVSSRSVRAIEQMRPSLQPAQPPASLAPVATVPAMPLSAPATQPATQAAVPATAAPMPATQPAPAPTAVPLPVNPNELMPTR